MRLLPFTVLVISCIYFLVACGQSDEEKDRQAIMQEIKKHTPPPPYEPKTPGIIAKRAVLGNGFKKTGMEVLRYCSSNDIHTALSPSLPFNAEITINFEDKGKPEFPFQALILDTRDGRECHFAGVCIESSDFSILECRTKPEKKTDPQTFKYLLRDDFGATLYNPQIFDNNTPISNICGNNFELPSLLGHLSPEAK